MPTTLEKRSQTRLIIASTLFVASIAASLLISYLSHSGSAYWVVTHPVPKGAVITSEDIVLAKSTLPRSLNGYLSKKVNPIGSFTRRSIEAGELLYSGAISATAEGVPIRDLSLSLRSVDIPPSVSQGDRISLYHVHDIRNGEVGEAPQLVISSVFLREILKKGSNFGGEISITVSLNQDEIPIVLAATTSGRLVAVASHG